MISFGRFFASSTNSLRVLYGCLSLTDQHHRVGDEARDRDEIVARELRRPAEQLVHLGEARDRDDVHEQRVAVGLGVGGELAADLAGGARPWSRSPPAA